MSDLSIAVAAYIAYLFGSISSAIIVCKIMRLPDPRTQGSRNPGATNVLRIGGKKAAIITLIGDMLKGFIPVLAAHYFGFSTTALAFIAFAAFLGHLFPIFFRFEGGKGVATAIGCLLAFNWQVGLGVVAIWLVVALCFRYSSLASLLSTLAAPFLTWYFTRDLNSSYLIGAMTILLVVRHKQNITNLFTGKESKIGKK